MGLIPCVWKRVAADTRRGEGSIPVKAQSVFVLPLSAISVSIIVVFLFKIYCKSSQFYINLQDYWEKYAWKGEFFVLLHDRNEERHIII